MLLHGGDNLWIVVSFFLMMSKYTTIWIYHSSSAHLLKDIWIVLHFYFILFFFPDLPVPLPCKSAWLSHYSVSKRVIPWFFEIRR